MVLELVRAVVLAPAKVAVLAQVGVAISVVAIEGMVAEVPEAQGEATIGFSVAER
jgi:hypothetical protein